MHTYNFLENHLFLMTFPTLSLGQFCRKALNRVKYLIHILYDITWISSQVWPPRSYQSWRPPVQTPLRPQGDSASSSTYSLGPRCTSPVSCSVTLIRKHRWLLLCTDREANRKMLQKHSLLAENLFSFLDFPDFFRQLSQMKLLYEEEKTKQL